MKIICFSGLGADEQMYSRLQVPAQLVHMTWYVPEPQETIPEYARRYLPHIPANEPFGLMGLSFGGVLVQELAKLVKPEFIILISSLEGANELPWYYRCFRLLPKRTPYNFISGFTPTRLVNTVFGATEPETRRLLRRILTQSEPRFIRWAIYSVLRYSNSSTNYAVPVLRLHGRRDKLIGCPSDRQCKCCTGGGHLMVFEQAGWVSEQISRFLKKARPAAEL